VTAVGRLENIVARNQRPNRMQERVIVSMVIGAIILLILVLAVFTDLGQPPDADRRDASPAATPAAHPAAPAGPVRRVDGILLATPPAKPKH
jgi:hypothetical protein